MPLLQLLARLRTMATQPDPAELRERVVAELQRFETRADAAAIPADQSRRAHYALCASLDEMVTNTPWGARSSWTRDTLVTQFHAAVGSGRFFDLMRQAVDKVATLRPLLELMAICLSLGVMGQHRDTPQGAAVVEGLRTDVSRALLGGQPPGLPLSARWKGVEAPFVPGRSRLPMWVAASAGLAAVAGAYLLISLWLNDKSDALFDRMAEAPPAHMPEVTRQPFATPPPPDLPPAEPSLQDRLRAGFGDAAGMVGMAGTANTPVIRLPERAVFAGSSATVTPQGAKLIGTLATVLRAEGAHVQVIGYTDNRPVHTVLFPSAFQLSLARGQAVAAGLARQGVPAVAEGRAGADPIASNANPEGREQNRRIELVVEQATAP